MKLDPERLVGWLIALVLLALVVQQTVGAVRDSGVWTRPQRSVAAPSPYAGVERLLTNLQRTPADLPSRDPFVFGRASEPAPSRRPALTRPAKPVEPQRPRLTAIIWVPDNPSATIRWNGQDRTVQVNSLFEDFRVRSIGPDQVILEHGAETLVLQLPRKGD